MKGWLALDIDGTITQDKYSIPQAVIDYLREMSASGWKIALATGRAFVFAVPVVENLDFPFILLPQNGSLALDMPSREVLFKSYLSQEAIPMLEFIGEEMKTDFLIYSGFENRDRCYYRPKRLSKEDFDYVKELEKREREIWIPVESFNIDHPVPLVKFMGSLDVMQKVAKCLRATKLFQVSLIHDRFVSGYYILLVTDRKASKGLSLQKIISLQGKGSLVIAAGDDENDISLLKMADVKIAMPHAPESLRKIADFIAPPVNEQGIIQALKIVISNADNRRS